MFHIPLHIAPSAICGGILTVVWVCLSWDARFRLRERNLAAMILFGFGGFAFASALATGWARAAFDQFGVSNGNASRYTVFGAYLMIGELYYLAAALSQGWWKDRLRPVWLRAVVPAAVTLFVLLSFVSYGRAVPIYADVHQFNLNLSNAYRWGLQPTDEDNFIHPQPSAVLYLKRQLQLLEIGPYRDRSYSRSTLPVGPFAKVGLLSADRKVTQPFTATDDGLKAVTFKFIRPNGTKTEGAVAWAVSEKGSSQPVAQGTIDATRTRDWVIVRVKLPYLDPSKGRAYEFTLTSKSDDAHGLGIPLYRSVDGSPPVVVSDDVAAAQPDRFTLELVTEYAK
jgi:hypothetical protein